MKVRTLLFVLLYVLTLSAERLGSSHGPLAGGGNNALQTARYSVPCQVRPCDSENAGSGKEFCRRQVRLYLEMLLATAVFCWSIPRYLQVFVPGLDNRWHC